mgnify:CR=1 FL=1
MKKNKASTPCLGICSTTYGDNVCKGCKRFVHEVINWNKYSIPEKELVNNRLEDFKLTVLQERLSIINPDLLASKLRENGINFNDSLNPLTWVFDLLRASGSQSLNLDQFGVSTIRKTVKYPNTDISIDLYPNVLGAFSYYHIDTLKDAGLMDESFYNALEHVDQTYQIIKKGYHPPFRWFADIQVRHNTCPTLFPTINKAR